MILEMKKFGDFLISRPAGREAFLAASAYILPNSTETSLEDIHLDFNGVIVVAPSWLDEFLAGLCSKTKNPILIQTHGNLSLIESCKVLDWPMRVEE